MKSIAYKVLTENDLTALKNGIFNGSVADRADGYIHLSTASQLRDTISKHFLGQENLTIAAVDLDILGDAIRWEPSRQNQLFPHLYAALTLSAVIKYHPLQFNTDGTIRLPDRDENASNTD